MNICSNCHQALGEELSICPVCVTWMNRSRTAVDEYRIDSFVHEGHGAIGYRAHREGDAEAVFIRVFKPESGITPETAARLRLELETLRNLPAGRFVRHIDFRRSPEGYWYRVSEWLDAEPWGDLIGSGYFLSTAHAVEIFLPIAEGIAQLHAMCDLDYVPNTAQEKEIKVALVDSFGLGGTNVAILYKKI